MFQNFGIILRNLLLFFGYFAPTLILLLPSSELRNFSKNSDKFYQENVFVGSISSGKVFFFFLDVCFIIETQVDGCWQKLFKFCLMRDSGKKPIYYSITLLMLFNDWNYSLFSNFLIQTFLMVFKIKWRVLTNKPGFIIWI